MGEQVDSSQKIWETMRPLLSYLESGPHTDLDQLFTLILRMIDNYPPILVSIGTGTLCNVCMLLCTMHCARPKLLYRYLEGMRRTVIS
jgi:hypothetical protein